jgi:carboxyl-terminal processing protease
VSTPTTKQTVAAGEPTNLKGTERAHVDSPNPVITIDKTKATSQRAADPNQDDGLQADERSIKADLADAKARKAEKDVVLHEAANILADEVGMVRSDTKLAARVLPHALTGRD